MQLDPEAAERELWGGPLHGAEEEADELLRSARTGELSLRLRAPAFVALDQRDSLPVVISATGAAGPLARLAVEQRAILVAVEQDTGFVRVDRVVRPDAATKALPPAPGFEGGLAPENLSGDGERAVRVVRLDLKDRLGMPWPPGAYALTVLAADRMAPGSIVRVGASPRTHDPAIAAYAEAERARRGPPAVWPPPDPRGEVPHYLERAESPAVPGDLGIALSTTRVTTQRPGARCLLHGAFRLPLRRERIAAHGAIVPVTLVITGSEDPSPIVLGLEVPSFDAVDAANPPPSVVGHFSVDLFALTRMAGSVQTYFVYAFSGPVTGGPALAAVVTESAVARVLYAAAPA